MDEKIKKLDIKFLSHNVLERKCTPDHGVSQYSQSAIKCSKLTTETLEQGVKLFKVDNKETRTTPMASYNHLF